MHGQSHCRLIVSDTFRGRAIYPGFGTDGEHVLLLAQRALISGVAAHATLNPKDRDGCAVRTILLFPSRMRIGFVSGV
ncbi:UNVERIFIED_ORG: hypothetical protein FHU01_4326 [Citrobacter freundii]